MLPKSRRPIHPGQILREEYLEPLQMTQEQLGKALGITRVRVNEIVLGKRKITTDTAYRLARFFSTSVDFWLNLQRRVDLFDTLQGKEREYENISPLASKNQDFSPSY
jgi:addiction module HigA family antidote